MKAPQNLSRSLPNEIEQILREYETGMEKGDPKMIAELFTENGYLLPNQNRLIQGKKRIAKFYDGIQDSISLNPIDFMEDGRVGVIIGVFSNSDQTICGKFTITLQKQDSGDWKIYSDIYNRDY
jgi:ketosteroid isomerase-like protein